MSFKEKIVNTTKNFIEKYIYSKKTVQEKNNDTKDTKTSTKDTKTNKKNRQQIYKNDKLLEIEVRKEFIRLNEEKKNKKTAGS